MSVKNNVYPNTRAEDERLVRRGQDAFALGEVKDIDSLDIPENSVAELINMRATATGLSGRPGSFLWSPLELPSAFDQTGSGITFTRTGNTVTTDVDFFLPEYVNYKLRATDNRAFFIDEYVDEKTIRVSGKDVTGSEDLSGVKMRGPINASYVDSVTGDTYYLIGKTLVGRVRGTNVWSGYTVIGTQQLYSSVSSFHKVGDFVVLNNQSGIYVLNQVEDANVAIKINEPLPQYKINRRVDATGDESYTPDPSAYNYAYGYTLLKDVYNESRYSGQVFALSETPGKLQTVDDQDDLTITPVYKPDGKNSETTTVIFDRPISCRKYVKLDFAAITSVDALKGFSEEAENPFITFSFNGIEKDVVFDFKSAETFRDIKDIFEDTLRSEIHFNIRVVLSKYLLGSNVLTSLNIYSENPEDSILAIDTGAKVGYLNLIYNNPVFGNFITASNDIPNVSTIKHLRPPSSINQAITSYTVYRSQDIYPSTLDIPDLSDERIQNSPVLLGIIDDVPACKLFGAQIFGPTMNVYSGNITDKDIGNTFYYTSDFINIYSNTIGPKNETGYYTLGVVTSPSTINYCWFGVDTYRLVNQTDNTMTVVSGDPFSALDVGKAIYFGNGSYDFIKSYNSVDGSVDVIRTATYANMPAGTDLTSRVYNDITSDADLIDAYIPRYPYTMRFFQPMPNTNIASLYSGYLVSAVRDKNKIYYSEADELSRIGYHHSTGQLNVSLEEGVKSITNTGGYFTVASVSDSYIINPEQGRSITNESTGAVFFSLPSPMLSSSGIGSTHQSKWSEGMNAGLVAVTSEPAVRFYDGVSYGPDLSDGYIRRAELQKMDTMMIIGYDHNSGVFLWGRGV